LHEFYAADYEGKTTLFDAGMNVTHVTDEGVTCRGRIVAVGDSTLLVKFTDGDEGWEKPATLLCE
jgi:hypothetical protein